jgi:hypothetical protein
MRKKLQKNTFKIGSVIGTKGTTVTNPTKKVIIAKAGG